MRGVRHAIEYEYVDQERPQGSGSATDRSGRSIHIQSWGRLGEEFPSKATAGRGDGKRVTNTEDRSWRGTHSGDIDRTRHDNVAVVGRHLSGGIRDLYC